MNRAMMSRALLGSFATVFLTVSAHAFSQNPGPVQNISTLNIYRRGVEVSFDPPAMVPNEVKSYYVEWVSSTSLVVGSKTIPQEMKNGLPTRTVIQVQPLAAGQEYAVNIYPVDTQGSRSYPGGPATVTTLTRIVPLGSYENYITTSTMNGTQGFLFLPELDLPNMRPNIEKLSNDLYGGLNFGGNLKSNVFDFAAIANNSQEHWHWDGRQTAESDITTRLKGSMYIGDQATHYLTFDNDKGPLGTRAWYVILTPTKLDRIRLVPIGDDGDDQDMAYPLEQIRVRVQAQTARVARYHNGVKIQEQTFNWRTNVYFNVRQRLQMGINQNGVTFFADTNYTGELLPIGTFGTDLTAPGWQTIYTHLVLGQYPDFESSRAGYNGFGTLTQQDAFGLMHWGNVAFDAPASSPSLTELSYFKDPDLATRSRTMVDGTQPFTITIPDTVGPDIVSAELDFTDASNYPKCDAPGTQEMNSLATAQIKINGTTLTGKSVTQLNAEAPAYHYMIPPGILVVGNNTVSIVQSGRVFPLPIFFPHIDLNYPTTSAALNAYTPPGNSPIVDMMPADSLLRSWSLPSVDFAVPRQASGTMTLNYTADATHTMENAGLIVNISSMAATIDGAPYAVYTTTGIGTIVSTGTASLDTTQYPNGYHNVLFNAYTVNGSVGVTNGSETNTKDYDPGRRMLIYNGPAVTTLPVISNLVVTETKDAMTPTPVIRTQPVGADGTAYVNSADYFDMTFDVTVPQFLQSVQLLYMNEAGMWVPTGEHIGGNVGLQGGYFDPGISTMTVLPNGMNKFTLDWNYTVTEPFEKPFISVDPDGPWTHYEIVATNVSGYQSTYLFRYKLHDPYMALISAPIPASVNLFQQMDITLTVQNIGSATWPGDGSFTVGPLEKDEPLLVGMAGIKINQQVVPGQSIPVHIGTQPIRPTPVGPGNVAMPEENNLVLRDGNMKDFYMSTTTLVSVVSGNNAVITTQPSPTSYMNPNSTETITLTVMNTGVTTWTAQGGYALFPSSPDFNLTWGIPSVPLGPTDVIGPQASKTFKFKITAPGFPQVYSFQWRMGQATTSYAEEFGDATAVSSITVGSIPNVLTFLSEPTDQWVQPGQTATIWATVKSYPYPAAFQWQLSTSSPPVTFTDIPGATGSSYTTDPVTLAEDGYTYQLVASTDGFASNITSRGALVRISTSAPTIVMPPATYQVSITNGVLGDGLNYLPGTVNLNVVKSAGLPAENFNLVLGQGNNPIPLHPFPLDAVNAGSQTVVLGGYVKHDQVYNFAATAVDPDGTTETTFIPDAYTVLLVPPPPPTLNIPGAVDGGTKVSMAQNFTLASISHVNLGFSQNSMNTEVEMAAAMGAPSATASLTHNSSTLNFGTVGLARGNWTATGTSIDWVGNVSLPNTEAFNVVGNNLSNTIVYPNPWDVRSNPNAPLRFGNLTADATIKIFTVSGHFVAKLQATSGVATWDLKNDAGQGVASGIYLYVITNNEGDRSRGVFTVIR